MATGGLEVFAVDGDTLTREQVEERIDDLEVELGAVEDEAHELERRINRLRNLLRDAA